MRPRRACTAMVLTGGLSSFPSPGQVPGAPVAAGAAQRGRRGQRRQGLEVVLLHSLLIPALTLNDAVEDHGQKEDCEPGQDAQADGRVLEGLENVRAESFGTDQ